MTDIDTSKDGSSLTTTEAGQKFCYNATRNFCLGSHCMAWRWEGSDWERFDAKGLYIERNGRKIQIALHTTYTRAEVPQPGSEWYFDCYGVDIGDDTRGHWRRKIPEHQRKGYCGACEKVTDVEISS